MDNVTDLLIDALGGTTAVATGIHAPTSTVHSWRKNGIPPSRLAHMRLVFTSESDVEAFERFDRPDHVATDTTGSAPPSPGKSGDFTGSEVAA